MGSLRLGAQEEGRGGRVGARGSPILPPASIPFPVILHNPASLPQSQFSICIIPLPVPPTHSFPHSCFIICIIHVLPLPPLGNHSASLPSSSLPPFSLLPPSSPFLLSLPCSKTAGLPTCFFSLPVKLFIYLFWSEPIKSMEFAASGWPQTMA